MIFAYTDKKCPGQAAPVVVMVLIGANLLVYLTQALIGFPDALSAGLIPYEISHGVDLIGDSPVTVRHSDGHEEQCVLQNKPALIHPYVTLVSCMFIHGSLLHLIGNMFYLWIFGDQIEHALGKTRFVLFYLLGGLTASAAQILMQPQLIVPMVGASGAIAAVLGAYLVLYPENEVLVFVWIFLTRWSAWVFIGTWFMLQAIYSVISSGDHIAYAAHIGGFIFGVAAVKLFAATPKASPATSPPEAST